MEITLFPGGATLVELPDSRFGLIDCDRQATEGLLSHLHARGNRRFAFVAVTHWHLDQYSGLPGVLDYAEEISAIYLHDAAFGRATQPQHPIGLRLSEIVAQRVRSGRSLVFRYSECQQVVAVKGAEGKVLAQITASGAALAQRVRESAYGRSPDENRLCAIFRLSVSNAQFLIAGDATTPRLLEAFEAFKEHDEQLAVDGLVLPHHGARQSMSVELLLRLAKPTGFLAVVEPLQLHRLPHSEVIAAVQRLGGHLTWLEQRPIYLHLADNGVFCRVAPP